MADDRARAHKEEGNRLFNLGNFERAVVEYWEGIKLEPQDILLKTVLFSNRATALYKLERYVESLNDAVAAKELTPTHTKALYRGALCYLQLEKYLACLSWCDEGLKLEKGGELFWSIHDEATDKKRPAEVVLDRLIKTIRDRGINIEEGSLTIDSIVTIYNRTSAKLQMIDTEEILWPVVLLYSEHGESDFIEGFIENISLHLYFREIFFERAPWDTKGEYTPDNLKAYFCNEDGSITPIGVKSSLLDVMKHRRFKVRSGKLEFFITSLQYDKIYRTLNRVVE